MPKPAPGFVILYLQRSVAVAVGAENSAGQAVVDRHFGNFGAAVGVEQ